VLAEDLHTIDPSKIKDVKIVRTVVGGRGTFHCPRCQRAPATRTARRRIAR